MSKFDKYKDIEIDRSNPKEVARPLLVLRLRWYTWGNTGNTLTKRCKNVRRNEEEHV